MTRLTDFISRLHDKVAEQLHSQRLGYLLGAGSAYLDNAGYPLASQIWNRIKDRIKDPQRRGEIQAKLDSSAQTLEQALDQLDEGGSLESPHRSLVTDATAELFASLEPPLDTHVDFVKRLSQKGSPFLKLFTLNYDPLIERAAEYARVRVHDGFTGHEHAYFEPAVFEERIGRIRGTYKARQFHETTKPIHLIKLHGSLGWYECPFRGIRRCRFASIPRSTKRLMIPPQRRKANETMTPPYSSLWSAFRGSLGQDANPLNRLACIGYGFTDEHVNAVIEGALAQANFSLLILSEELSETVWTRWSAKTNAVVVTKTRCSIKGETGPGHPDLWRFEKLAKEV